MKCDVCGQRVAVSTGNEGTSSYEPVAEQECSRLESQLAAVTKERDENTAKFWENQRHLSEQVTAANQERDRLRVENEKLRAVAEEREACARL